ncbi:Nramp family divalent metal transporter [Nonlabens xiamenensis]|uniref:Nramp family divalent metal transporter n=1 Tax=Nonlabens xiamenensis TaxID=2341043 RepID=UPI000F606C80|nr:Nramp family divalent metal transporter [Nonlabens xiamenensis]
MLRKIFKNIGPATLVTAAFVGPGTITVCTLAGAQFGYSLLWAMLLSIIATIILQEMAARLGLVTQKGLPELMNSSVPSKFLRFILMGLVLLAIAVGNAAYEAGNISGGSLGLEAIFGKQWCFPTLVGLMAFILLWTGSYKILERVLMGLVVLMGVSFIATAIAIGPELGPLIQGLLIPKIQSANFVTVVALVGTTVVPYNLFLHAALVKEKWNNTSDLRAVRMDTIISVVLGGLVSMAVIVAASALQGSSLENAVDLASALEPVYGTWATYVFSIGILAAGITSAITAPLAAAYVVKGFAGWNGGLKDFRFKAVWIIILVLGVVFSSLGWKPIKVIQLAQVANGLLLPIIALILVWLVNLKLLGRYRNNIWLNLAAIVTVGIALALGIKTLIKVFQG